VVNDVLKSKKRYGRLTTGKGKRVLIEFANPNTHKEVHIGHLRNFTLGQAATNILIANGYDTTPVSYINDLGNNVAKCLWGIKHLHPNEEPEADQRLNFLGRVYTEATQVIDEDPTKKEEVSAIQKELESGEGEWIALWKKTHKWSIDNLKAVFDEFGLTLDRIYLEHELIGETHDIVNKLLTDGIAKMSEGATIVDLEDEKLGANLLRKSDGTLLYNAKDIALAYHKETDYHADRSIYVIDVRQSLAMKQLAATLRRMGFPREVTHLSYEMVTLPEGAMSSRKGTIVRWTDLRDAMIAELVDATKLRHPDWATKKINQTAKALAMAAVKFMMLRHDPEKILVFDMHEAMATDGFTGPYIMYTIARISSLEEKAEVLPEANGEVLKHPMERELIGLLARYPEIVGAAGIALRPSVIAQYAFELSQAFAKYYAEVRILDAEQKMVAARLALGFAVRQVLVNAMDILNISIVKAM
ncbi:MAG: arginine--tRNA ligase, partial [Candidatus Uhrbacteria bacterium]|nr:arginine--tRNA ligase [Candidatus Uhrbacteria bacterium]